VTAAPWVPNHADDVARLVATVRADPALRQSASRRLKAMETARLAGEILVTYARVRRAIPKVTLPDLLEALRGGVLEPGVPAWKAAEEHVVAVRLSRAVRRLLPRLPGDTRCLTQSLVLTALLARRGVGSRLLIAVAPGEDFAAHAWVEHGGVSVLPAEGTGFGRLVAL
jgi:hypothetical protein